MKEKLYAVRMPQIGGKLSEKIRNSLFVLLFGIALGILSKWLDSLSLNDAVWWQHWLGVLDLRNVFSELSVWLLTALAVSVYSKSPLRAAINVFLFFAAMCVSYHWYTVRFCGFNPRSYMMIWYGITILSPLPAMLCWYGKGKKVVSLAIDILVLAVMASFCFSFGFWYFDFRGVINAFIFAGAAAVLYSEPKNTLIAVVGAAALAMCFRMLL